MITSSPIVTANWETPGTKWTVLIGGSAGRVFKVGKLPINGMLVGYDNLVKPQCGADRQLRTQALGDAAGFMHAARLQPRLPTESRPSAPSVRRASTASANAARGRDGKRVGRLSGHSLQSRAQCRKDWLSVRLGALVSSSDAVRMTRA